MDKDKEEQIPLGREEGKGRQSPKGTRAISFIGRGGCGCARLVFLRVRRSLSVCYNAHGWCGAGCTPRLAFNLESCKRNTIGRVLYGSLLMVDCRGGVRFPCTVLASRVSLAAAKSATSERNSRPVN